MLFFTILKIEFRLFYSSLAHYSAEQFPPSDYLMEGTQVMDYGKITEQPGGCCVIWGNLRGI